MIFKLSLSVRNEEKSKKKNFHATMTAGHRATRAALEFFWRGNWMTSEINFTKELKWWVENLFFELISFACKPKFLSKFIKIYEVPCAIFLILWQLFRLFLIDFEQIFIVFRWGKSSRAWNWRKIFMICIKFSIFHSQSRKILMHHKNFQG